MLFAQDAPFGWRAAIPQMNTYETRTSRDIEVFRIRRIDRGTLRYGLADEGAETTRPRQAAVSAVEYLLNT